MAPVYNIQKQWLIAVLLFTLTSAKAQLIYIEKVIQPQMVAAKSNYYIITQGVSDGFNKALNINISSADTIVNHVSEFDPSTLLCKKIDDLPAVRSWFGSCLYNNKLYLAGGYNSGYQPVNTVFVYDPDVRKWKMIKPMLEKRTRFSLECIGNKIYAIGGEGVKNFIEVYSPDKDSWEILKITLPQSLLTNGAVITSTIFEDKIYFWTKENSQFAIFSPKENAITEGPVMPVKNTCFDAIVVNKKIYVACGQNEEKVDDMVYMFDLLENQWYKAGKLPNARFGCGIAYYNKMFLFIGGSSSTQKAGTVPSDGMTMYKPVR